MQHEDAEPSLLLVFPTESLPRRLDVLLELPDGVLERRSCVVHLVHDQNVLANQIGHLETAQIEPLRACHFGAGRLNDAVAVAIGLVSIGRLPAQILIQRKPNRLNGDVRRVGTFEEGSVMSSALIC